MLGGGASCLVTQFCYIPRYRPGRAGRLTGVTCKRSLTFGSTIMSKANSVPQEQPLDMVIFGGAGDLSIRKLLPALFMAYVHKSLPDSTRVIAVGRTKYSREDYLALINEKSLPFIDKGAATQQTWASFLERLHYVVIDAGVSADYDSLVPACQAGSLKVFYLATAPDLFSVVCENLSRVGLADTHARVVLEKPLGHDLASAKAINSTVTQYFPEDRIYRIDHYLGKETVQNLMVLRFGNPIFGPLWQAPYIKSVQITVAEFVGVGSRADFYDHTGAMRDMVQNHLMQLLCIVAMEPPVSLDPDAVRDEKVKVLRSLRPMSNESISRDVIRAQYHGGVVDGAPVKGYRDEANVPADSDTETFVALRVMIDNWRWANVPFFLRTGKRFPERRSEIVIEFADMPFSIIPRSGEGSANRLVIRLQPEESIQLQMLAKEPGSGLNTLPVSLDLDLQSAMSGRRAEAYERLLIDVIRGRLTHFMRSDELEAAWSWVEEILNGWKRLGIRTHRYAAGTYGPPASYALMARNNTSWPENL